MRSRDRRERWTHSLQAWWRLSHGPGFGRLPPVPADVSLTPSTSTRLATITVWAARIAWLGVALLGGRAVGAALADQPATDAAILTVGAWAGWAMGALALSVPAAATLTAARVVVPGALAVALTTILAGAGLTDALALAGPALLATVLTASADVGRRWVQASAYGDEQRFPLRPPVGYLVAAVLAWLLWMTAVLVAVTAVIGGRLALGLPTAFVALAGVVLLPRRWHQLSRRWLVTVPAGLVVHDPVVLGETLMVARRQLAGLALTVLRSDNEPAAADLTGPTAGHGIEVRLNEPVTALFAPRPGLPQGRAIHLTAFLVAPSRPGAVLADAHRRFG